MSTNAARLVALSLVASMGCASGQGRYAAYGVEVAAVAVGTALLQVNPEDTNGDEVNEAGIRQGAVTAGWVLLVAGLAGLVVTAASGGGDDAPSADERAAALSYDDLPPLPEIPGADPEAVRMTKQARRGAQSGACQQVRLLAPMVNRRDPQYYAAVFRADPTLQACL